MKPPSLKIKPGTEQVSGPSKIDVVLRPPAGDTPTADEIDQRVKIARDLDPAKPNEGKLTRLMAINWLRNHAPSFDLAPLGLPLDKDDDTVAAEADARAEAGSRPDDEPKNLQLTAVSISSPRNAQAEHGVVAGLMQHRDLVAELLDAAPPEDFAYAQFRYVVSAARALHDRGAVVDAAAIIHELGPAKLDLAGGASVVAAIGDVPVTPEEARSNAEIVHENAGKRYALRAFEIIGSDLKRRGEITPENAATARGLLDRAEGTAAARSSLPSVATWPAPPAEAAWHGVLGEIVRAIEPQTEADPVALLAQFLVCYGSVIGRGAHWVVNSTRHFTNLNAVVVGPSGVGTKGTGMDITEDVVGRIDCTWMNECLQSGLSTGEGMIEAVRDQSTVGGVTDMGVVDKRALWSETEFAKTIACMGRNNSILAEVICQAWDGKPLRSQTRANPVRCKKPHVSILAQTTIKVIRGVLNETLRHSGFGNRFLWVCSRRSKELPFGGDVLKIDLRKPLLAFQEAISFGAAPAFLSKPVDMDRQAREIFTEAYGTLIRPRVGGAAPLLDRAHAQVRRLALVYALLDRSKIVQAPHLEAALAFWDYCERSAEFLFGDPVTDPLANKVLAAIRDSKEEGMNQNEINRNLFGGRKSSEVSGAILALAEAGLIEFEMIRTRGGDYARWYSPGALGVRALRARGVSSS